VGGVTDAVLIGSAVVITAAIAVLFLAPRTVKRRAEEPATRVVTERAVNQLSGDSRSET
jgi:hypothetical protein